MAGSVIESAARRTGGCSSPIRLSEEIRIPALCGIGTLLSSNPGYALKISILIFGSFYHIL